VGGTSYDELVVITLWEEGENAAVPRRFTDALEPRRPRTRTGRDKTDGSD
jgi:hypothetical protein